MRVVSMWVNRLAMLAACLALAGCKPAPKGEKPEGGVVHPGRVGMNVLFVSVDTTRADALGCYGHPVAKTPNIDRLAAEGTRFAQCISSIPITLPSHSTMMTGSYPFVHGARENGSFVLGAANVTLAEIFQAGGYATHAQVATVALNRRYGLNQGFDTYGDLHLRRQRQANRAATPPAAGDEGMTRADSIVIEEVVADTVEPSVWSLFDRPADEITKEGIALLERSKNAPFFIFLHYFDPHQPYQSPERFASQYKDPYLAEIGFFDEQFGKLMDAVRDLGLAENTLVILTSDHGEGRGQHGEQTHSFFLYDSTLHVPLILWCPGQVPAGRVVDRQVRLLDLAPTVVAFTRRGRSPQMQGVNLLPLLTDEPSVESLPCYADTLSSYLTFGYAPLRCLRADGWKYIHGPTAELYHVAEDRLELFNLAENRPEQVAEMRDRLRQIIAESPPPPGSRAAIHAVDPQEARKLQALGYAASAAASDDALLRGVELDHFEPRGIDPRARLETIEIMNVALGSLLGGDYEASERYYRRVLVLEPQNADARRQLGITLEAQEQFAAAEAEYRKALELKPNDMTSRLALAHQMTRRGDYTAAEEQYRLAAAIDAAFHLPHLHLANLLSQTGRMDEAFVEYAAAAVGAPDLPEIHLKWGMAYRAAGRPVEAEAKIREACRLDAENTRARRLLAFVLAETGRRDEAMDVLRAHLERQPDDVVAMEMLAAHHNAGGEFEQASEYFNRAAAFEADGPRAQFNLGLSLALAERYADAVVHFRRAIELRSDYVQPYMELAAALEKTERLNEAMRVNEELLALEPRSPLAYVLAANLLDRQGMHARAIEVLRQGHAVLPENLEIANDLAWRLATSQQPALHDAADAIRLAEEVVAARGERDPGALDTLAAAYARAGRFAEAVAQARRAAALASDAGQEERAVRIRARIAAYERREAYTQP